MKITRKILLVFLIMWVVVIISAYFVVQKPWDPGQNVAPLLTALDVVLAICIVLICGGLGCRILGQLHGLSENENAAIQLGIGVGVVGITVLSLGLIGVLSTWLGWVFLLVGMVVLRREVLEWVRSVLSFRHSYAKVGGLARFAAWVSLFLLSASFLYALAPPLKWDSLVYHLELPRQYLASGRIEFLDDNVFIGYPQLAEMIFTWAMALKSATTAATVGWFISVVGILGVGGFAGRLFEDRSTFLAPAILLTGASISRGMSWAYVDLWVLLFGLSMLVCLEAFARSRNRSWIILGGVFAGLSVSTKYTGGMLILLGGLLLIVDWFEQKRLTKRSNPSGAYSVEGAHGEDKGGKYFLWIIVFGLVAAFVFLPWLSKNLILTRSPTYPLLFPGRGLDDLRLSFYVGEGTGQTVVDDLLIPINATILGVEGKVGFNTSIGPLLLALIPGIAIGSNYFDGAQKQTLKRFLIFAVGAWIIWAIVSHISGPLSRSRHYFGVFPAFAILAAAGFEALANIKLSQVRISRLVGTLIVFTLSLSLLSEVFTYASRNPHNALLGLQSSEDFLAQELGWFSLVMDEVNNLPEGSRVQFLWEARGLYCEVDCVADVIIDRWWHLRRVTHSNQEISKILEDGEITHVLIYNSGAEYIQASSTSFDDEDWAALDQFREEALSVIEDFEGSYTLYKLGD